MAANKLDAKRMRLKEAKHEFVFVFVFVSQQQQQKQHYKILLFSCTITSLTIEMTALARLFS